ncbi:MAG: rhomboid family intramembrane serine protease [Verrucomicrobiota bacterium]
MKMFRHRFQALLTPGVQWLLCLLAGMYVAAVIGKWLQAFDLYGWLTLSGSQFWSGQIWRLVTYALLPAGVLDFSMNSAALVMLGAMLERHWSRGELWLYCVVAAAGAGLAKVILQFSGSLPLVGAAPMMFGLLIAWGVLCGREVISVVLFGEMTVWKLVLGAGAVGFLILFLTAGLFAAIIMAGGGMTGFLYLWVKHRWLMSRAGSVVHSERISRLEL